jgi:hypothetical protein
MHYPYQHASNYTVFNRKYRQLDYSAATQGSISRQLSIVTKLLSEFDHGCGQSSPALISAHHRGGGRNHGEEMFENGRLAHTSTLDEPQITTSLLMAVPGFRRLLTRLPRTLM